MKSVIQPARGRPSKVTKPATTSRQRPVRRGGAGSSEPVPNQDPSLDADLQQQVVDDSLEQHQPPPPDHDPNDPHSHHHQIADQQQHHHQPTHEFSADHAASLAAAVAQAQQHHEQQLDLSTAASILANSGAGPLQHHHEHPDLAAHMESAEAAAAAAAAGQAPTTEELAHESGYSSVVVESALAKRLAREPGMRLAQQRRPEQVLNLSRRSNVEALFAHIAGENAPVSCKNCHKGHGPWSTCVVVDGQMCGSCANCWFNASGARCSFHETRNPQAHGGPVLGGDPNAAFQIPPIPQGALGGFNFVSGPASTDPVVRFQIERAMAEIRGADKKARAMLMIEVAAKQLAFNVLAYEEALLQEEQEQQQHGGHSAPPAVMEEDAP